ncbi:proline racemase family protein [Geothrix sp. PMB-07]|uniref:proline racemase family protein n=1 Tax=Geothrix sp. PMB-07 TaxID=3068640 RepID=UPI0027416ABF|nr:proline racemase family protein [Geothrix sp. PMB-07]WLT30937.1 proline racemase family protein [Geothrix sp. PMB-07]
MEPATRIHVFDSHTGGEPTRVVLEGGPDLGSGPLSERQTKLQRDHAAWRRALVCEPRASEVLVGALVVPPHVPDCNLGVIFFNNVGVLGMCGHGTMGVVETLRHAGKLQPGRLRIDTPVGVVEAELLEDGSVLVINVPARRCLRQVPLQVPGLGLVHGDVAWGGNGFFLVDDHGLDLRREQLPALMGAASAILQELERQGLSHQVGFEVNHVELTGPAADPANHGRNFVLCPGLEWDRSPCGTGTSAKLACLLDEGKLAEGQIWRQESLIGSVFKGWMARRDGLLLPHIQGRAHMTAEATLILDPSDPFVAGFSRGA